MAEVRAPASDEEWHRYYELRWRVLRAPWNQPRQAPDSDEASSIHRIVCLGDGCVVAAGRAAFIDEHTARIRYMAVDEHHRGRGYAASILAALEQAVLEAGGTEAVLHARESAVGFYRRHGYRLIEKSHLLFDEIQHYYMRKQLGN